MGNENDIGGKVGLDITDFKANIGVLTRQVKVIETGFAAAAAGMDGWGKSEEGLQARIKALNDITDLQRQKVANLAEQYAVVAAEKGETSKAAQDLQVRINKETGSLNKNERELRGTVTALDNFGVETADAAKETDKFDDELSEVQTSLSDLGGKISKAAIVGVAAIGTAFVGAAAGAFKLASDAGKLADDLITMSNQTGISTDKLQELEYAARFVDVPLETMTKGLAKVTKAIGESAKAGQDYIQIADGVTVAIKDSNGQLKSSEDIFYASIDALGQMTNETERDIAAQELFGKSFQEINPLIKAGSSELVTLAEEARNVGTVLSEDTLEAAGLFDDSMEKLKGSMKGVTATIGAQFAPAFTTIADSINAALPGIVEKIKQIDFAPMAETLASISAAAIEKVAEIIPKVVDGFKWIGDNAGNIAAGIAGIGAAMITYQAVAIVDAIVKSFKAFKLATEGATIAQWALNAAQAANPIGLIVTLIAGLVAGIIVLWNTNDKFRNAVIGAWEAIKNALVVVIDWVKNNWGTLLLMLTNPIAGALKLLYDLNPKFKAWVDGVWDSIVNTFKALPETITGFFNNIIDGLKEWGVNAVTWVTTEVPKLIEGILNFFNELPGKIGYALGYALGTLVKWGVDAVKWVIDAVPKIISNIVTFFSELPAKIGKFFTELLTGVKNWGVNVGTWIATEIPKLIMSIVTFFSELPGKIGAKLTEVISKITGWASNALTTIKTEVPKIISSITGFFGELPDKMIEIGKNIVTGLWEGIKNSAKWLGDKISDFAGGIVTGMKDALGIHSPSTVAEKEVGEMWGAGVALGVGNSTRKVNAAVKQLNNQITSEQVAYKSSVGRDLQSASIGSGSITKNEVSFADMFRGANFVVRNDNDLTALGQMLGQQVTGALRSVGVTG